MSTLCLNAYFGPSISVVNEASKRPSQNVARISPESAKQLNADSDKLCVSSSSASRCFTSFVVDEGIAPGDVALPLWMEDVLMVEWGASVSVSCHSKSQPVVCAAVSVSVWKRTLEESTDASSIWSSFPASIDDVYKALRRHFPLHLPSLRGEETITLGLDSVLATVTEDDERMLSELYPPLVVHLSGMKCPPQGARHCVVTEDTAIEWVGAVRPPLYRKAALLPCAVVDVRSPHLVPFDLGHTGLDTLLQSLKSIFVPLLSAHCSPISSSEVTADRLSRRSLEAQLLKVSHQSHIRSALLTGPEGVGKSVICSAFMCSVFSTWKSVSCIELFPGGSIRLTRSPEASTGRLFCARLPHEGLVNAFAAAEEYAPCMLVLYELDTHLQSSELERHEDAGKAESTRRSAERTLEQLLSDLEQTLSRHEAKDTAPSDSSVAVDVNEKGAEAISSNRQPAVMVIATAETGTLPQRVPGCFQQMLDVAAPSRQQRQVILSKMLKQEFSNSDEVKHRDDSVFERWADVLAGLTPGYVAQNLRDVCLQGAITAWVREKQAAEVTEDEFLCVCDESGKCGTAKVTLNDLILARSGVLVAGSVGSRVADDTSKPQGADPWDGIAGYESVKKQLNSILQQWLHPEALIRLGGQPPSGLLLHGPSGCGKTLFASAVGRHPGLNCVSVRASDVFARYLGDSEKNIRKLFSRARRLAPCVLFFDDIDSVGRRRADGSASSSGVEDRVLATMLNEMDGIEESKGVYVMGATSQLKRVDAAILRPGRLEYLLEVNLPSTEDVKSILKYHARDAVLSDDVNWDTLAVLAGAGFTGSDAKQWVEKAANKAMERVHGRSEQEQAEVELTHGDFVSSMMSAESFDFSTP